MMAEKRLPRVQVRLNDGCCSVAAAQKVCPLSVSMTSMIMISLDPLAGELKENNQGTFSSPSKISEMRPSQRNERRNATKNHGTRS